MLEKVFIKADMAAAFAEDLAMYIHQLGITCNCDNCRSHADFFNSSVKNKVCNQCFDGYHTRVRQVSSIKKKSENSEYENYLTGSVGAILGALIGSILFIVVGLFGYFWSLCGTVMAMCTFKGYSYFGGKFGAGMIIIIILILTFMTFASVLAVETILVYQNETLREVFRSDIMRIIQNFLTRPNVFSGLLKDFAFAMLFTGIGTFIIFGKCYARSDSIAIYTD